jgi:hypothetical protein
VRPTVAAAGLSPEKGMLGSAFRIYVPRGSDGANGSIRWMAGVEKSTGEPLVFARR